MADISTKTNLSVCVTVSSKLPDLVITNGQMIFIRDKHRIAFDFGDKRTFYNQIEELSTDSDRTSLSEPVNGLYYYVISTSVLWTYQDEWVQLTTSPKEVVYIGTKMPDTGQNEQTLYVNKLEKEISVWDEATSEYVKVANTTMSISESDVDLLFA